MGRYGAERHFSQLLDGKLPWGSKALCHGGYVIFRLRDQITKFRIHQILKYGILAEITKFNACQIFLLYSTCFASKSIELYPYTEVWSPTWSCPFCEIPVHNNMLCYSGSAMCNLDVKVVRYLMYFVSVLLLNRRVSGTGGRVVTDTGHKHGWLLPTPAHAWAGVVASWLVEYMCTMCNGALIR